MITTASKHTTLHIHNVHSSLIARNFILSQLLSHKHVWTLRHSHRCRFLLLQLQPIHTHFPVESLQSKYERIKRMREKKEKHKPKRLVARKIHTNTHRIFAMYVYLFMQWGSQNTGKYCCNYTTYSIKIIFVVSRKSHKFIGA